MISMAKYIHRTNSDLSLNQFNRTEEGDNDRGRISVTLSSFFSFLNSDAYTLREKSMIFGTIIA